VNVEVEENDPNSCLNYFKKAIQLRKNNNILVYGKYELIDKQNPNVYAYTRELDGKKILIVLNFSRYNATFNSSFNLSKATILLGNYSSSSNNGTLKPYEAVVYELK
jgi:oligo-1,6-glucosidase